MSNEIVVNFVTLMKASDDIVRSVKTMDSQLDGLKRGIQPMIATWDGEAQQAYYARQQQWESAATDLKTLLGQIQAAVVKSAEIMMAREKANASRF